MTPAQFADDLDRSRKTIEDLGGAAVRGYRAPSFSINKDTHWAHQIIAEQGYLYSSSINPIAHDHYGWADAPRFAFKPVSGSDLVEIPVTTAMLGKRRIAAGGGGFFRLLPYAYSRWAIRQVNREERPAIIYFHPWEIDPGQPRVANASLRSKLRHYSRLDAMAGKLERLIGDFQWDRLDHIVERERDKNCMNAPMVNEHIIVRQADLSDQSDRGQIDNWVLAHPQSTPFHRPQWLRAVEVATGNRAFMLVAENDAGQIVGLVPCHAVKSPLFGNALVSSGFAVGGGILAGTQGIADRLADSLWSLASEHRCTTAELRGGAIPLHGWTLQAEAHANFERALAVDDDAELLAIPRKQRAEVRKGLDVGLTIETGSGSRDLDWHYRIYSESVRNLGTPVFPPRADGADAVSLWR